jgi:regulator of ribosome biosynthesis
MAEPMELETEVTGVKVAHGIELDVGCLLAVDTRQGIDGTLAERATDGLQALVSAVFSLPAEATDEGRVVALPKAAYRLPREKPIPRDRPLTKWEQFAKEKGIQKRQRRDRLVWDEDVQDFIPRFGAGSSRTLEQGAILPHSNKLAQGDDPFAAARREKKTRVRDNKKKQLANVGRADKRLRGGKMKVNPISALDVAAVGASGKKRIPKAQLKDGIAVAQRSTASGGKFDKQVKGEPKRKIAGQKRKLPETVPRKGAVQSEKEKNSKILGRVLGAMK